MTCVLVAERPVPRTSPAGPSCAVDSGLTETLVDSGPPKISVEPKVSAVIGMRIAWERIGVLEVPAGAKG